MLFPLPLSPVIYTMSCGPICNLMLSYRICVLFLSTPSPKASATARVLGVMHVAVLYAILTVNVFEVRSNLLATLVISKNSRSRRFFSLFAIV